MALFYKNNINITGVDDPYISSSNITPTMEVTGFIYPGYIIDNWNTKADGSGTKYTIGEAVEDSSYYAIWKKPPKYLVTAEQLEMVADAIRENCTRTDTKLSYPWGFIDGIEDDGEQYLTDFLNGEISYINIPLLSLPALVFYYNSNITSVKFPVCTTISESAFYGCSKLTSINFPSCTTIGNSAFEYCSNLTSISFPVCTLIGYGAFNGCNYLRSINFPACTSISGCAFEYCYNLTSISFPVCTFIGLQAFYMCSSNLTSISFPACTTISGAAFSQCYRLLSAYFLGSSIPSLMYSNAFISTPIANFTPYTSGEYGSIFVRASMLEEFKSATNWVYYSDRMVGLTDEEIANL